MSDPTPTEVWPVGVALCVSASLFGIIGKIFLKLAHMRDSRQCFIIGLIGIVVLNPVLSALAYKYAAQSLIAPLAGLSIVWNTIIVPQILPEEITRRDVFGAILIFSGCIVVAVSGRHDSPDIPIDELGQHFVSIEFIFYLVALFILLIVLVKLSWPALVNRTHGNLLERISFAALAGMVAGQMFFLTAIMRILNDGNRIFYNPLTFVSIAGAVLFAAVGLYLLNDALRLYDAVFVIYIYESCYIVGDTISGICFFHDMFDLSLWHSVVYTIGMIAIFAGIYVVAMREDAGMKAQSEDTEEFYRDHGEDGVRRKLIDN